MPRPPVVSLAELADAMRRLELRGDGPAFTSPSSMLRPVTLGGRPAMLKLTHLAEELTGALALEEWDGDGAVRVLARDRDAVVLERAGATLGSCVGDDGDTTRVLCAVAARLHGRGPGRPERFPGLRTWFASLLTDTRPQFDAAREIAGRLLADGGPPVLLHGDLHPANVLCGGPRGWLAIDPKGIVGPREFDYLNLFTNGTPEQAVGGFDVRLRIVSGLAGIDRPRLLRWIAAWSALSGIWHLDDGQDARAELPHAITALALERLAR